MHARNEEKNLEALTVFFLVCTSTSRVDRGRHARKNLSFWETYVCACREEFYVMFGIVLFWLGGAIQSSVSLFCRYFSMHTAVLGKSQTKSNESSMLAF